MFSDSAFSFGQQLGQGLRERFGRDDSAQQANDAANRPLNSMNGYAQQQANDAANQTFDSSFKLGQQLGQQANDAANRSNTLSGYAQLANDAANRSNALQNLAAQTSRASCNGKHRS